jgi:signal transduction histidine kinase
LRKRRAADKIMARSLVADLSAHTTGLVTTARPSLALTPSSELGRDCLEELETAFARFDGRPDTTEAFRVAAKRAHALVEAAGGDDEGQRSACLAFAADALAAVAPERTSLTETVDDMVTTLATILEITPETAALELFLRTASNPGLHALPPLLTLELQMRLLLALAPISDVSLWAEGQPHRVRCVAHVGGSPPTRRIRHVARSVLDGEEDGCARERGTIHGVPVLRWQQPHAVLVARARPEDRQRTLAFLEEAAARIGTVLEREMLLERNAGREHGLVVAREKRLLRLGFDLHDGPIQDLVALASDVRLAQEQLGEHVSGRTRELVLGRFEDIGAQIAELDGKIRALAHSLEPSGVIDRPLAGVLRNVVESFERRVEMQVTHEVTGNFDSLTASQRIALYQIVQEGLANVRNHSEATDVLVSVRSDESGIEAQIVDDGKGFRVERTLIRAAKGGRLGLVGIGERVRLLGGTFDVQSKPGGPTTLSLRLPRWEPPAALESR